MLVLYAKDIVDGDFISMPRTATALEAAKVMKERRHGYVVVAGSDGTPEGIVTEWDYVSRLVAEGRDPATTRLEEIMTTDLVKVDASEGLDNVAQLMSDRMIRRVLVVEKGKVLGIITARTMLGNLKQYVDRVSTQVARLQGPTF
jgi:signal-transduction protein with cAMP-binding, CBS, and nucleotidyltransferase domain